MHVLKQVREVIAEAEAVASLSGLENLKRLEGFDTSTESEPGTIESVSKFWRVRSFLFAF